MRVRISPPALFRDTNSLPLRGRSYVLSPRRWRFPRRPRRSPPTRSPVGRHRTTCRLVAGASLADPAGVPRRGPCRDTNSLPLRGRSYVLSPRRWRFPRRPRRTPTTRPLSRHELTPPSGRSYVLSPRRWRFPRQPRRSPATRSLSRHELTPPSGSLVRRVASSLAFPSATLPASRLGVVSSAG